MSEVVEIVGMMRDRVDADLIVDADTGYGNALNVGRTMRLFERAGASAIQLEDQAFPKRCGHLDGKVLVAAAEMAGKIKAALDARRSRETLVNARTDAIAVEGFERAIERAALYRDAGADVLFVEAPKTRAELKRIPPALGGVPLLANMVEGGKTPPLSAAELESMGFALVIFPGGIVRALGHMASEYYASLAASGTSKPFRSRMLDFTSINELIGTPEMLALGKRYESPARPSGSKKGTRR
jgi:2-methylisocitrate lyase-like PEP mutase family enzyme